MEEQSEIFELTLKIRQEQNVLACRNNKLHAVGSERTITFFFFFCCRTFRLFAVIWGKNHQTFKIAIKKPDDWNAL